MPASLRSSASALSAVVATLTSKPASRRTASRTRRCKGSSSINKTRFAGMVATPVSTGAQVVPVCDRILGRVLLRLNNFYFGTKPVFHIGTVIASALFEQLVGTIADQLFRIAIRLRKRSGFHGLRRVC